MTSFVPDRVASASQKTRVTAPVASTMGRGRQTAGVQELSEAPDLSDEQKQQHESIKQGPMKVEVKHLEKRYDGKGSWYIVEQETSKVEVANVDWWQKFALCVTHQLDPSNQQVTSSSVQINSPVLKDMLREVIGNFPGVSFLTKTISLPLPARALYHYRPDIEDAGQKLQDGEAAEHVRLLLDFIDEQFEDTIAEHDNLIPEGLISYGILWTIFRPGTTVYGRILGQHRAFTLLSYQYECGMIARFALNVSFVDYDGEEFGIRQSTLGISPFSGAQRIDDCGVHPLDYSTVPDLKSSLIARGRVFEALAGQNFRNYKGIALQLGCPTSRYNVEGRVMIDCETFHRLEANRAFEITPFPENETHHPARRFRRQAADDGMDLLPSRQAARPRLSDERCLLANATVRGFSFSEKKFLDFFVDQLGPVEWNEHCFDQLVLPAAQKALVQALVATHSTSGSGGFDDIVKGKGKGLVFVLHGPPGVGKTLTAECVAEFSQRPLYIVSSGDLGTHSEALDSRLSRIMDMASTWRAVLLIDEADVFLEERSSHDVERNSLVSIFLRVLEYYEGILFLTTNRVSTFDEAFKSRIHVPLKYANLPAESRKKIWKNMLSKVEGGVEINEEGYDRLSASELNGRQVKNVVRTAGSLARFNGRKLDVKQLEQVVTIQRQFEQDLVAGNDNGIVTPPESIGALPDQSSS